MASFNREYYEKLAERHSIWEMSPKDPLFIHEKLRAYRLMRYVPKGPLMVLDCGCGDGYLSVLSAQQKNKVVSLDFSLKRLEKFSQKAQEHKIDRIGADSCLLPFKTGSFDLVLVSELLEHVEKDDWMLREIYRVLKVGGLFVMSVPYKEMVNSDVCPKCFHQFYRHGHLRSYDKPFLKGQLIEAGFKNISFRSCNNGGTRKSRAQKILPFEWVVTLDSFFSTLFPEKSRFLIALSKKAKTL